MRSVWEMHWVYDGAPRLNNFLDGLRAVQGGPEAGHTTVSGPSYGSTAVGAASKAPGHFAVDDVVVAGSPGTLVGDASDLASARTACGPRSLAKAVSSSIYEVINMRATKATEPGP
jgi:hypothetical protein